MRGPKATTQEHSLKEREKKSDGAMVRSKLRVVLVAALAALCCVLIFKVLTGQGSSNLVPYDEYGFGGHGLQLRKLNQPFAWNTPEDDERRAAEGNHGPGAVGANRHKNDTNVICRNSVQGKKLIADDRGYVCHRDDILGSGCCNSNATSSMRYVCHECHEQSGCCQVYEHCISCCMDPRKKPVLMGVLNEARSLKNILLLSVSDHFELCLAKCRTSSRSVQHENIYINPQNKFCYTKEQSSKAGDKP